MRLHRVDVNEHGRREHRWLGLSSRFLYAFALWALAVFIGAWVAGVWPGRREEMSVVAFAVMVVVSAALVWAFAVVSERVAVWWKARRL